MSYILYMKNAWQPPEGKCFNLFLFLLQHVCKILLFAALVRATPAHVKCAVRLSRLFVNAHAYVP